MLAQHIKEILADETVVLPPPELERAVVLEEPNVMRVTVAGLPTDAVVINLNRIGSLAGIKDGDWKQSCDYLIVFRDGKRDGGLFLELKRTLHDGTRGYEQLRRSLPILRYLQTMCAVHFRTDTSPARAQYALIGERSSPRLDKQPVRMKEAPQVANYKGIGVVSAIGKRFAFTYLVARRSRLSRRR